MKKILLSALPLLALAACAGNETPARADYRTVPLPAEIEATAGEGFRLDSSTPILCADTSRATRRTAGLLAAYIGEATGFTPSVTEQTTAGGPAIRLSSAATGHSDESYTIGVTPQAVTLHGASDAGLFRAVQTLRKSIGARAAGPVLLPAVRIADRPAFGYRGAMLDVARTFYPVEEVKRAIDLMALHNLNVFHWHLTDDQGWRIEIDAYPELTRTGAFRRDTLPDGSEGTVGGFYTKEQIREVVAYAAERYIEVIPEIDMPGHMTAALASYPELGCTGGPYTITPQPGVRRDILCAGNPGTLRFAERVIDEVAELFPSRYIHIGGDESPRTRWKACPRCQARIRAEGLRDDAEHSAEAKLQGWFNTRIEAHLARHGRRPIGWDEIVDGGLSPDATVMSWRGVEGGIRAANRGFDVIMSPNSSLYFDYYQSGAVESEPPTIGGYIPLKKVYDTTIVPENIAPERRHHILGVQANLWTTYMRTPAILYHMMLPRLAALAEIGWSEGERDFEDFMTRLDRLTAFYDRDGYPYFPHFYDIRGTYRPDYGRRAVGMVLRSLPGATIRYTLDGSEPSSRSACYTDTVWIDRPASIRAVAFLPDGRRSEPYAEEVTFNRATMKPIDLRSVPHPKYSAASLNDGLRGKRVFTYGNWLGFQLVPAVAVIDLEKRRQVETVAFNALVDYGSHIMDAAGATVWLSDDGEEFRKVHEERYEEVPYGAVKRIIRHEAKIGQRARYVRIRIDRAERLPEPQFDRESVPFLFIDEIYVN